MRRGISTFLAGCVAMAASLSSGAALGSEATPINPNPEDLYPSFRELRGALDNFPYGRGGLQHHILEPRPPNLPQEATSHSIDAVYGINGGDKPQVGHYYRQKRIDPVTNTERWYWVDTPVVLTNVAPGKISPTSTDAVNGSQLSATNTTVTQLGNQVTQIGGQVTQLGGQVTQLGDQVTQMGGQVNQLDNRVTRLEGRIANNRAEANGGTTSAMALTQIRFDDRPGKLSMGFGAGFYGGASGMAFGLGYTTEDHWRLSGGVTYSPSSNNLGAAAGVSFTLN